MNTKPKVVIKLGGSALNSPATLQELAGAVQGYRKRHQNVVIVHGGGPAINQELTRRGIEWRFINGQRQTTPEMMEVINEVLAIQVNGMIVRSLQEAGIPAVGLSGARDEILFCTQANAELMQVGAIEKINTKPLDAILSVKDAPVPVLAPLGCGLNGEKFNINADWAAARVASALGAKKLIFLTDQNGILDHDGKLVRTARPKVIHKMIDDGVISGGMYTKVAAMMAALESGVGQVRVLNAGLASHLLGRFKIGTLLRDDLNLARKEALHEHAS